MSLKSATGADGVNGISQQNPVRLFVSHVFAPSDDYLRVFEYLESSHNFYYRNCSDPDRQLGGASEAKRSQTIGRVAG